MKKREIINWSIFILIYIIICITLSTILKVIDKPEIKHSAGIIQTKTANAEEKPKEEKKEKEKPIVIRKDGVIEETKEIIEYKQKIVDYLWEKTHNIDMILTFEYESGLDKDRIVHNYLKNGAGEYILNEEGKRIIKSTDYGICQLNDPLGGHINFIRSEEFKSWKNQADYCIRVYQDGINRGIIQTTFYGYNHRMERRNLYYINQEAYNIYWGK